MYVRSWTTLVVSLAALACGSSGPKNATLLSVGETCESNAQCESKFCDTTTGSRGLGVPGLCVPLGQTACREARECPGSFRSASTCAVNGGATDCQGTRRDATCEGFVCASLIVPDDSGCTGQQHDCGDGTFMACSSSTDQTAPSCGKSCAAPSDCTAPTVCGTSGRCELPGGAGHACADRTQCGSGLKCQNGVCCDGTAGTCCTSSSACTGGYLCDLAHSSCFTTCTGFQPSPQCVEHGVCSEGVCYAPRKSGESCVLSCDSSGSCEVTPNVCLSESCSSSAATGGKLVCD